MKVPFITAFLVLSFALSIIIISSKANSGSGELAYQDTILNGASMGDKSQSVDKPIKDLHGATIEWSAFGRDFVDTNGLSSITNLRIDGAKDVDIDFRVIVRAKIGVFIKVLFDEVVTVSKNGYMLIPINVGNATDLHEKQLKYVTRIYGLAVAQSPIEEINGAVIRFEERFLAFNDQGKYFETIDKSVKEEDYPLGFTTREGKVMAVNILNANQEEGVFIEAIGSGAYKSWWMTEEEKAAGN